ncbi:hypothetical protein AB6D11_00680 [Vibrio splendidus]
MNSEDLKSIEEISTYHHYLAQAVISALDSSVSNTFDMGEDQFVIDLFPYSYDYWKAVDNLFKREGDLPGVAVYELSDTIAEAFIGHCSGMTGLPSQEACKQSTEKLVNAWGRTFHKANEMTP